MKKRITILWQTVVLTLVALGLLCLCSCSGKLAMQKSVKGRNCFTPIEQLIRLF